MIDIVDQKTRSRMMSRIRGRDTKPEMIVRRELHKRGFRFRLYKKISSHRSLLQLRGRDLMLCGV